MQLLLGALQTSALVSDVQLAGASLTCTLAFTELTGSLGVDELDDHARGLTLEGQLPLGPGRLALSPERGLRGALAALGEIEVGDAVVDRAWVVRGDDPALLVALVPALRALARAAPAVVVDAERVRVRFAAPVPLVALGARLHEACALWERVATFRQGAQ